MKDTCKLLDRYIRSFHSDSQSQMIPLFYNAKKQALSRYGVTYILKKYAAKASPVLEPQNISPHVLRHTKAILYPQNYRPYVEKAPSVQHGRLHSGKKPHRKLTGLRALYYRYLYELGAIPRKPRRPSYVVRQDAYKLDQRIRQMEFLSKHNIDTLAQLETHRQAMQTEIRQLLTKRKQLPKTDDVQSQCESVNTALKQLRQEERLCRKIAEHSLEVQQHLTEARCDRAEQQQREQEHERDRLPNIDLTL